MREHRETASSSRFWGHYNPTREPEELNINKERALYWLSVGAQPTETVLRLLCKLGIWQEFHRLKKEAKAKASN